MAKKRKYSSKNFNDMIKTLKNPINVKTSYIKILEQPSYLELNSYFFKNKTIIFSQKENVKNLKKKKEIYKKIIQDLNFDIIVKKNDFNKINQFSEIFLNRNVNTIFNFLRNKRV